jgi:hypothetical protein
MNDRDRFIELAIELARAAQDRGRHRRHRYRQRYGRHRRHGPGRAMRWVKAALLMVAAAVAIPVAAVSLGLLFGKHGYEGLIASPLGVLVVWAAILIVTLRKRVTRRMIERADVAQLPEQTGEWLERQRPRLPFGAQSALDSIGVTLEGLAPQVKGLDATLPEAVELRRLVGEELPALIEGYQKLPETLRHKPLHGGPSPEQQLITGLTTIDAQLGRVHERLAEGDLYRLATHQRYLELKYKDDDELE